MSPGSAIECGSGGNALAHAGARRCNDACKARNSRSVRVKTKRVVENLTPSSNESPAPLSRTSTWSIADTGGRSSSTVRPPSVEHRSWGRKSSGWKPGGASRVARRPSKAAATSAKDCAPRRSKPRFSRHGATGPTRREKTRAALMYAFRRSM